LNNVVLWGSFRLEMINKGIELVEKLEKRVSDSVYKNVINELIAIITRSIQCFKSPEAKIEHYFFIYQNLIILKNHFRDSLEEEQAEHARRAKMEESKMKEKQRMFNFSENKDNEDDDDDDEDIPEEPFSTGIEEGGLSQYLWDTFKYWFTNDYQDVKANSLKIIEDELKNLAWNIKERINGK